MYVLLGKDKVEGCFSDFGGRNDDSDRGNEINTAMREFYEETCGVVLDKKALKNRMSNKENYIIIHSKTLKGYQYTTYVLQVPYSEYHRSNYRKALTFLKYIKVPKQYLEKSDICWVLLDSVLNNDRLILRRVFLNTIQNNAQVLVNLRDALEKSMTP